MHMGKQSAIISQEGGFDEIEEREAFSSRPGGVPCLLFLTKPIRFGSPRVTNARRMASPRPRRVLTRTPHRHITPPIPRFPQHRRGAYRARRIVHVSSAHGGVSQSVARQITSARTDSRGRRRRTSTSPPRASALASRSSPRAAMERTWGRRAGVLDRGARGGIGQRARDRARRTKRATRHRRAARVLRGTIGGRTPREACHPSSRSRTWRPGTCSSPWDFGTWGERRREGGAAEVSPDRVSEGGRTGDERVGG